MNRTRIFTRLTRGGKKNGWHLKRAKSVHWQRRPRKKKQMKWHRRIKRIKLAKKEVAKYMD